MADFEAGREYSEAELDELLAEPTSQNFESGREYSEAELDELLGVSEYGGLGDALSLGVQSIPDTYSQKYGTLQQLREELAPQNDTANSLVGAALSTLLGPMGDIVANTYIRNEDEVDGVGRARADAATAELAQLREQIPLEPGSINESIASAIPTMSAMVPAAMLGPNALGAVAGIDTFTDVYRQARDQGVEPQSAALGALPITALDSVTSRFTPNLPFTNGVFGKLAGTAAYGGVEGAGIASGQRVTLNQLTDRPTWEGVDDTAAQAFKAAVVIGGGIGAAKVGVDGVRTRVRNKANSAYDIEMGNALEAAPSGYYSEISNPSVASDVYRLPGDYPGKAAEQLNTTLSLSDVIDPVKQRVAAVEAYRSDEKIRESQAENQKPENQKPESLTNRAANRELKDALSTKDNLPIPEKPATQSEAVLLAKSIDEMGLSQAEKIRYVVNTKLDGKTVRQNFQDAPLEAGKKFTESARDLLDDETGSVKLGEIAENLVSITKKVKKGRTPDNVRWRKQADGEAYLTEQKLGGVIPIPDYVAKKTTLFSTMAHKDAQVRAVKRAITEETIQGIQIAADFNSKAQSYFNLKDRHKVDRILVHALEAGKENFVINSSTIAKLNNSLPDKQKLSPVEQRALLDIHSVLNEESRGLIETVLRKEADDISDPAQRVQAHGMIDEKISALKNINYIPRGRKGDYYVEVIRRDGKGDPEFHMVETEKEARKLVNKLGKENPDKIAEAGKMREKFAFKEELPANMRGALGDLATFRVKEAVKATGDESFRQHFAQAKGIKGYETDLAPHIAEYLGQMSVWSARKMHESNILGAYTAIDKEKGATRKFVNDIIEDYRNPGSDSFGATYRKIVGAYFLGGNVKSAALNMTQGMTTLWPVLSKYVSATEIPILKAYGETVAHMAGKEFKGKLKTDFDRFESRFGNLEQQARELAGLHKKSALGKDFDTVADASMAFFGLTERFGRSHAFVAAHKAWDSMSPKKKQRLIAEFPELDQYTFSEKIVEDTFFDYSPVNQPAVYRNKLGKMSGIFKTHQNNWIAVLRREGLLSETGLKMIGSSMALGGAAIIPGAKLIISALESQGYDLERKAQEIVGGDWFELIKFGVPSKLGGNLAGSLSMLDLSSNEKTLNGAIGNFLGGAAVGIPNKMVRAYEHWGKGGGTTSEKTFESLQLLMPEALRNASTALEALDKGAFTDSNNVARVDVSKAFTGENSDHTRDVILKFLGFTPVSLARAFQESNAVYNVTSRRAERRQGFTRQFSSAFVNKSPEQFKQAMQDLTERNAELIAEGDKEIKFNPNAIWLDVIRMKNPKLYSWLRAHPSVRGEIEEIYNQE